MLPHKKEDFASDVEWAKELLKQQKEAPQYMQERFYEFFNSIMKDSNTILDVASGHCWLIECLAKTNPSKKFKATDKSKEILEWAEKEVISPGINNLEFQTADALDLPFADQSFDGVICSRLVHRLKPTEVGALIQECCRVGKRVLIMDVAKRPWLTRLMKMAGPIFNHSSDMRAHNIKVSNGAYTEGEILSLARQIDPAFKIKTAGWFMAPIWMLYKQ